MKFWKIFALNCLVIPMSQAAEIEGSIEYQFQHFISAPSYSSQENSAENSVRVQLDLSEHWGDISLDSEILVQVNIPDSDRNYADIQKLVISKNLDTGVALIGIDQVYWSVTETRSLTNIVNQVDARNSIYEDEYLGQPLVGFRKFGEAYAAEVYWLPLSRERYFPSPESRLRLATIVSNDANFESSKEKHHQDWAARYLHYLGDSEVAISYFQGTQRRPIMEPEVAHNGIILTPFYPLLKQWGFTGLHVTENTIYKIEAVHRSTDLDSYVSGDIGIENNTPIPYTEADVDFFVEYLWDERADKANTPYQNDLSLSTRLNLNDMQSSEVRFSWVKDLTESTSLYRLQFNRRLFDSLSIDLDATWIDGEYPTDPLRSMKNDDYIRLSVAYSF
ncbi:hypothetical protein [Vibrio sp. TRT 2004]|uniref:hypothetical protein n=1 Tax=Vibrio sp. TRT 2004 TaxID=3418506 RepID=UPI003CF25849